MNGSLVGGVQLKVKHVFQEPSFNLIFSVQVSLARRQPVIDPINDASSRSRTLKCIILSSELFFADFLPYSSTWSTIAASHSQKGSHRDKREMVTYEEDLF